MNGGNSPETETENMDEDIYREIEQLQRMPVEQLQQRYREVFGEPCRTKHKLHLVRRIAWKLQVLAAGDISERARQRALALVSDADLRAQVPAEWIGRHRSSGSARSRPRDRRLPAVGTVLRRTYRGRTVVVNVLKDGFEYEGCRYGSLSAIAREATGTRWNGLLFFGLTGRRKGNQHATR